MKSTPSALAGSSSAGSPPRGGEKSQMKMGRPGSSAYVAATVVIALEHGRQATALDSLSYGFSAASGHLPAVYEAQLTATQTDAIFALLPAQGAVPARR